MRTPEANQQLYRPRPIINEITPVPRNYYQQQEEYPMYSAFRPYNMNQTSLAGLISPPQRFSKGMNFDKWINEFEAYARATGIVNKRDALLAFLDGECVKLLRYVNTDVYVPQAYEQLKAILKQIFGSRQKTAADKINEFYARSQKAEENVRLFMAELTALAYDAFPQIPAYHLKEVIACQFTRGLRDTRMRDRIQQENSRDPDLLLERTVRAEGQLEAMQAGSIAGQCGIQNVDDSAYWSLPNSPQAHATNEQPNVSLVASLLSSTPQASNTRQHNIQTQRNQNQRNQTQNNATPVSANQRQAGQSTING
jgi:hypothetical protein